jgi:cytochrome c-type biogenesis protein CcsB
MGQLEGIVLWAGVFFYIASFALFLAGAIFKSERPTSIAWTVFVTAFCLQTASIALRWVVSGHPPVLWTYEHALASSWFVALIFIIVCTRTPAIRELGTAVSFIILMVLGYGIMSQGTGIEPLPPPYQSNWLWVHVTFAWLAYSAFAFSALVAAVQLIKASRAGPPWTFLERLPSSEKLEELIFRIILFGFVALTVEMGAGALWAFGLWGRYWAWDPMETWTLISWLIYGLYIHLRVSLAWRGDRMAWLAIIAFAAIFITFGGIAYMKGLHATLI